MTNHKIVAMLCAAAFVIGGCSLSGVGGPCTYAQNEKTIVLTCEGESTQLTVGDDGAQQGPPDSFWTRLKKN